jgi:hypothetical protein
MRDAQPSITYPRYDQEEHHQRYCPVYKHGVYGSHNFYPATFAIVCIRVQIPMTIDCIPRRKNCLPQKLGILCNTIGIWITCPQRGSITGINTASAR